MSYIDIDYHYPPHWPRRHVPLPPLTPDELALERELNQELTPRDLAEHLADLRAHPYDPNDQI